MASIDRTAYPRFKRVVPVRELNEAFTPTADEVAWAVDRSLGDSNLLSLVVLLKSYQRLGYFPNITDVPASVVEHIRGELGLAIGVDRASEAERTLKRQRDLVREHLGMVYEPKRVLQVAEAAIRKAVQTKDNPPDLVNVALEELVRGRCELPGYSTLDRLAATIRTEVNSGLFDTVAARLDHAARSKLESLLLVDPASRRSEFDNLKSWAQAPSLGKFRARLLHLQGLDGLGPSERWLADAALALGVTAGQNSDNYVRATVFLASVLFLVGISTHFPVRSARYGLIALSVAVLVAALVQLAQLPLPPP